MRGGTRSAVGGFIFAENPSVPATEARILWDSQSDPGVLSAIAVPAGRYDPDVVDVDALAGWLTIVEGARGCEHVVLSEGLNHIRLDVEEGSLRRGPVVLHYRLYGVNSLEPRILRLRQLLALYRRRRFLRSLHPREPKMTRWLLALRIHDAREEGASLREIAEQFYGAERASIEWAGGSDSMRSSLRRLAAEARRLAEGGYKSLMRTRRG